MHSHFRHFRSLMENFLSAAMIHVDQDERVNILNCNEGVYSLSHMYDQLLLQERSLPSVDEKNCASCRSEMVGSVHY